MEAESSKVNGRPKKSTVSKLDRARRVAARSLLKRAQAKRAESLANSAPGCSTPVSTTRPQQVLTGESPISQDAESQSKTKGTQPISPKRPKMSEQPSTSYLDSSSSSDSDSDGSLEDLLGLNARKLKSFSAGDRSTVRDGIQTLLDVQNLPAKIDEVGGKFLGNYINRLVDNKNAVSDALKDQKTDHPDASKEKVKVKEVKSMLKLAINELRDCRSGSFGATVTALANDELLTKIAGSRRTKRLALKLKDDLKQFKVLAGRTLEEAQQWVPKKDQTKKGPRQFYAKSFSRNNYYGGSGSGYGGYYSGGGGYYNGKSGKSYK